MLSCREITECSSALVDGELGFRARWAVRMHLAMCVHCRRFTRQLRLLINSLRLQSEDDGVPSDFVDRVMAALDNSEPDPDPAHTDR
ncbi:MAG: anti-sigma factor family protein [Pseudomonadales bacterium]